MRNRRSGGYVLLAYYEQFVHALQLSEYIYFLLLIVSGGPLHLGYAEPRLDSCAGGLLPLCSSQYRCGLAFVLGLQLVCE